MKDRKLLVISLAWSLIGIFLLMLVAIFTEPQETLIANLEENLGKTVIVNGDVTKATYKENVAFIDIKDKTGKVSVVLFEKPAYQVVSGDAISVKGKVQIYKDELEIVADEIACLACGNG